MKGGKLAMAVNIDIFGGVVCRDIFRHDELGRYNVKRCISGIPITTLSEAPIVLPKGKAVKSTFSAYDKRMLETQVSRKATDLLKASNAKTLIIDLTDELLNRFLVETKGKKIVLAAEKKYRVDIERLYTAVDKKANVSKLSALEMDLVEVEKSYKSFVQKILKSENNPKGYEEKDIVVIEAYYTEKRIDNATAILVKHPEDFQVQASNELLQHLYQILYQYIPSCQILRFPKFTHTSENHIRGVTPLSYTEDMYRYYLRMLDILFGYSKANSMHNTYEEQNLSNQLFTRLLCASGVHDIAGVKKDVANLKKKLKK